MSTKPTKISEFTEILNEVKDDFSTENLMTIHNLLWQIIVNRMQSRNKITIINTIINGRETLVKVMSTKKGFINTGVQFKKDISEKRISEVVEYLNFKLFNQSPSESELLVAKSF